MALFGPPAWAQSEPPELLRTDSRAPYVHRLTLYDHDGTAISPGDKPAQPYSPRTTCGKCHPYAEIRHGWHFNAPDRNAPPGRAGEPWLLVGDRGSSVTAISGRGWPGTVTPEQADLSHWRFTKRFGRHTPGGGYGEPSDEVVQQSPEKARWRVSGRLEIDCMICHSADQQHDPAEHARQIEKENFRWAPTAALNLAVIRGEASKVPDDWDPLLPPNPDFKEQAGPLVIYDKTRFDADDRVLFNITRRVPNERCYFCHSTRLVGPGAPEAWHTEQDVHLAAGLLCVDCHRHGIDHAMTRGYEGESDHPARAALTCRGCHYGSGAELDEEDEGEDDGGEAVPSGQPGAAGGASVNFAPVLGGRLRAPYPEHRGFPPLHFREMSCTACHSGPSPQAQTQRVQTALAHGLGLPARDRAADMAPAVLEPVFARIRASAEGGQAAVVRSSGVDSRTGEDELPIETCRLVIQPGGALAETYRWPFAHDVRPARQALGAGGCIDCHASEGSIFFGTVSSPSGGSPLAMPAFHGYSEPLARAWAVGFGIREGYKWFGFGCLLVIALVLLRALLSSSSYGRENAAALSRLRAAGIVVAVLGAAVATSTSFVAEWLSGEVAGWRLLVHLGGGTFFLVGLTVVAMTWLTPRPAAPSGTSAGHRYAAMEQLRSALAWLVLFCGFGCALTMFLAMLPAAGTRGQNALIEWHEWAAWGLLLSALLLVILQRTRFLKKAN